MRPAGFRATCMPWICDGKLARDAVRESTLTSVMKITRVRYEDVPPEVYT
jgi:hypothetical protein